MISLVLLAQVASTRVPPPRAATAATWAATAPVIDGRDDDPVWQTAALISDFREEAPIENGDPVFRTTGRIAYDAHYLYVFVRAFDPHPDSIVTMLARRDASTPSDELGVLIDGYRDRRTGFEFDVNPSGVKSDYTFIDDGASFDDAWDGVWDVATLIDSLGWTAEFRIPLSQLRYPAGPSASFGIYLWRVVRRTGEGVTWPLRRLSRPGLASQFGDVTGLDSLAPPRRVELAPYALTRSTQQAVSFGADLKYALASNLTLSATVNPDFGQVDADPAELNLTQFETFFAKRRPFFVEGGGLLSYNINCGAYSCYNESLFYSRRIGRSSARIAGAGKLTGHLGALSFGALGAATNRNAGIAGSLGEPAARFGVFRASESLRQGETGFGIMLTGMSRDLDSTARQIMHRDALSGGFDFRHRFRRQYVLHGSFEMSRVEGSAAAITATQTEAIHNFQRPDGVLRVDSAATSLSGDDEQIAFDKMGGVFRFQGIYTRRSPGFEVNDLGFLRQADQQTAYGWWNLTYERPTKLYRRLAINLNSWWSATTAGLVTDQAVNGNVHWTLHNFWTLGAWGVVQGLGNTWCDGCARGGPALRQDIANATWWDVTGDNRHRLLPELTVKTSNGDRGRSNSLTLIPSVTLTAGTRLNASLAASYTVARTDRQWLGNVTDSSGITHFTFARLDQRTIALTARANYTLSTMLSIQGYLQPFASWGTYTNGRELANPRAANYDARFKPWSGAIPGGVTSLQLNANIVLRWEYHPGSTLFAVWTQDREAFAGNAPAGGTYDNLRGIFDQPAHNVFLLKISHWFNW